MAPVDGESSAAPSSWSDITDEEARQFGIQWVKAVSEGDATTARQLIDWDSILDRSLDGLTDDTRFRNGFKQGAGPAVENLVAQMFKTTQGRGCYEFVGEVRRNGESHVVLRLVDDQVGLNYHDLRLRRHQSRLIADELFIAATGEAVSHTMRNLAGTAIKSQQSVLGQISGQAAKDLEQLETLARLRIFRDRFEVEFDDLRQDEIFERFVKSPEFQTWLSE